ncbi:CortBP2 domain-containing protein [Aphelenchoides bicaudatus]|nr:CortBP2 domain-containing protein [Aphelenchoides bicaudatus]
MKPSASNAPAPIQHDLPQYPETETRRLAVDVLPRDAPIRCYDREELVQLLAVLEGELQARDVAMAIMRSQQNESNNAAQIQKLLRPDVNHIKNVQDPDALVQLGIGQFRNMNSLLEAHKKAQTMFKEKLLMAEDQHTRQLFELRDQLDETKKSVEKTKQGLCAVLEERIEALKAECTRKQEELDKLDEELKKRDSDMEAEKERQKTIVLFMLNERKNLLSLIHQLKLKMKDSSPEEPSTSTSSANVINELKKQLRIVCEERNGFSRQCNNLQSEKANLLNVIHNLEEDVMSLKANSFINKPTEIGVGGYIVVNKGAVGTNPDAHQFGEVNNTGTVRFNKSKGPASFPTKSFEVNYQNAATSNMVNGNVPQRQYTVDGGSSLPRPSSISTSSSNSARAQAPAMGIRGSQMRNTRPAMGVAAQQQDQQSTVYTSQFPTTASDISSYTQGNRQVRMIPIDHQGPQPSNIIHVPADRSLTKRSTSLPRKMSNENMQAKLPPPSILPTSPSKIRPPSQNHAPPQFYPPIPQRGNQYEHKSTGHTHIA